MTWPFENDTSGIVKRISNRSISANRKRNIFIILTIALASALLSAIVLYGFGVMQETQNRNQKTAQIMYHAISEQQGQELYKQEEIAWVGEFFNAFSEQVNHSTVNFTYANADMLKSQSMPYSGDLPALENEIVVQESFLDSLGYSNELGQTIQIPFSDGTTHDFKLTGILDVKTGDIGRYTAIISKELVRQQYGDEGMNGYIVKGIGGFYYVKTPDGIVECKPRGIFRKQKITPVAGDEVTLETENDAAVIAQIEPRKNVFVRPPVANLDVLFLVASTTQPTPSTLVLDKLSAIAVDKGVQPVVVCTKSDLAEADFLANAYAKSTLPFIRIDYESGAGLDEVKQWINSRLCAFCGNSGVGKSTLLNALLPDAARETSAISQKLGRGRHTTREVTIFEAYGGRIADTPGFASLEANRAGFIPKENLEHAFPEFGPYLGQCQFTGCSHRSEKGCAVRAALAEGKLSQTRYDSYCAMYDEVKDVKDWQRPKV